MQTGNRGGWYSLCRLVRSSVIPWLVLAGSLGVAMWAWRLAKQSSLDLAEARFASRPELVRYSILGCLADNERLLSGCAGLVETMPALTPQNWRTYLQHVKLAQDLVGGEGVGFAQRVRGAELAGHLQQRRAEGLIDYEVWPAGERPEYFPAVLIGPSGHRDPHALGQDLFAEPVRRAAMEQARDTGQAALSGKLALARETAQGPAPVGFLMFVPVYDRASPRGSVAERRTALVGFIYRPIRAHEFLEAAVPARRLRVQVQLYEGAEPKPEHLLYASPGPEASPPFRASRPPLFSRTVQLAAGGHTWTVVVSSLPSFEQRLDMSKPPIVLGAGLLLSFLLFGLTVVLVDRHRAQVALGRAKEEWERTFDSVPDLIAILDEQQRIVRVNRAMAQRLGKTPADCVGQFCFQCFHGAAQPPPFCPQLRLRRDGRADVIEMCESRLGGEFLVSTTPVQTEDGTTLGVVHVARDITELKRTQQALEQGKAELEQKVQERTAELARANQELRQARDELAASNSQLELQVKERTRQLEQTVAELQHFSYTITHDLRAPLRAMQGFGGILVRQCAQCPQDQRRDFTRRIAQSADRMDNLITDALNYAKALREHLELEPVDAAALLRGMLESYPEFQPPRAEIHLAGDLATVLGNRAGLTQCFSNLLGNAVKFVHPGTVPKVRVWAEPRGQNVRFWFEDNGIGIALRHQELIFETFQRLSQRYEGTGIGLALVRKVVERMNGQVGVESQEGSGSRFWVELPQADERKHAL